MVNNRERLKEMITEMDRILNNGKFISIEVNNYEYIASSYKFVGNFIIFYLHEKFVCAFHYLDIKSIKEANSYTTVRRDRI
jgi:hypothetical protein